MSVLSDHGITSDYYMHAARKFHYSDFLDFDYILAMDEDNLQYLQQARRKLIKRGDLDAEKAGKVMLFGEFGGRGKEEVVDPYYGARNGFELAYEQMVRFSAGFLSSMEKGAKVQ